MIEACGRAAAARTPRGPRAAGRWPGGRAGLDRGATRRGGRMGRTPMPCREPSRPPPRARRAETGLAAAAGNGTPQPPRSGAAQSASRASRSQAAGSPVPEGTADRPSQLSCPTPAPRPRGAAGRCRAPAAGRRIPLRTPGARRGAPPLHAANPPAPVRRRRRLTGGRPARQDSPHASDAEARHAGFAAECNSPLPGPGSLPAPGEQAARQTTFRVLMRKTARRPSGCAGPTTSEKDE